MNIQEVVFHEIERIAREDGKAYPTLQLSMGLSETGIDSLGMAKLVTYLEDLIGVDPFTLEGDIIFPATLGDLISLYERAFATHDRDGVA